MLNMAEALEDGKVAMGLTKKEVSGFGEWWGEKGHREGETVCRHNSFGVFATLEKQGRSQEATLG